MGFKCGIAGLPNVGKSTLFNALTGSSVAAENYPFCTVDPNTAVVEVPDEKLQFIAEVVKPQRVVPAVIQFVDIAGLVKGASRGEGLGNKFLAHVSEMDALIHMVRCFENENISHIDALIDPVRDYEIIETELCLRDLATIEKRLEQIEKLLKAGDRKAGEEMALLNRLTEGLNKGVPAKSLIEEGEEDSLRELYLLTLKPTLVVANVDDSYFESGESESFKKLESYLSAKGLEVMPVSADMEATLAQVDSRDEEREFLEAFNISEPGINLLVKKGYELLDLVTFYTTDGPEVKAWTVKRGTKAPGAAGKIHTDLERGFICAEVIGYYDLEKVGTLQAAREKGLLRVEGKGYTVRDLDVIHFKFNV